MRQAPGAREGTRAEPARTGGRRQSRRGRRAGAPHRRGGRLVRRLVVALVGAAILLGCFVCGVAWVRSPDTANVAALVTTRERATKAHPLALSQVAPLLREAVVATEDERF